MSGKEACAFRRNKRQPLQHNFAQAWELRQCGQTGVCNPSAVRDESVKAYYQRLIDNGTRPELARVSVARKLASIALAIWESREEFDAKKAFTQDKITTEEAGKIVAVSA